MHYFLKYLNHLISATNQHGVHSPFVYEYVTKCLYNKKRYSKQKDINTLFKSIAFFSVEHIMTNPTDVSLETLLQEEFNIKASDNVPVDLIYFDCPREDIVPSFLKKVHNNSILFFSNIHQKKERSEIWERLTQHEDITVSIDLFYCGMLFVRTEQVKEHFKIRI